MILRRRCPKTLFVLVTAVSFMSVSMVSARTVHVGAMHLEVPDSWNLQSVDRAGTVDGRATDVATWAQPGGREQTVSIARAEHLSVVSEIGRESFSTRVLDAARQLDGVGRVELEACSTTTVAGYPAYEGRVLLHLEKGETLRQVIYTIAATDVYLLSWTAPVDVPRERVRSLVGSVGISSDSAAAGEMEPTARLGLLVSLSLLGLAVRRPRRPRSASSLDV